MSLREDLDKLAPRERKLLAALGGTLAAFAVLLGPYLLHRSLEEQRQGNVELRDLIATIQESKGTVAERRAKREALLSRYAHAAPPLAGFIEEAARSNDLAVPESSDKPEIPHGKKYVERTTVVKMHKIGLKNLVKMLEKIEKAGYPVAITRLNLKPRSGEPDSYEVELGVSAYDRKPDGPGAAPSATPSAAPRDEELP